MKHLLLSSLVLLAQLAWAQTKGQFRKLNDALADPLAATHVVVNCNSIEAVQFVKNAKQLERVTTLRLEGGSTDTDWNTIFRALEQLPVLTDLHISYAEIKEIPAGIDNLCLQRVKVSGTTALSYDELFIHLSRQPALRELEMDYNKLLEIPKEISQVKQLTHLSVTNNAGIDPESSINTLGQLPNLRHLVLKDNEIEELPSGISSLKSLELLDISGNLLEELPSSIMKLRHLDSLYLHDNVFDNFTGDAQHISSFKKLRHLSVDDHLDPGAIAQLRKKLPQTRIELVADEFANAAERPSVIFHQNSLVKPPLPELAMKPEIFDLDAADGGVIEYKSGTKIKIPAGALVDAQGNAVTGNVSISYREFQDPLDILLSGIPMTYDSGGVRNQFETAGMFEMYASQGDKELFVKSGAKIDIEMASSDAASSFNFYALNENSKNWDYLGKAGTVSKKGEMKQLSGAWRIYHSRLPRMFNIDEKPYKEIFDDTSYFYLSKKELAPPFRKRKKSRAENYYAASPIILKPVSRESKDSKTIVKFEITQRWQRNDVVFNDEIKAMSRLPLVYEGQLSPAEFKAKYIRKRRYNDIRFTHIPGTSEVKIELKDHNGIETITASIYPAKEAISNQDVRMLDNSYKAYVNDVKRRQKKFDKAIADEKKKRAKDFNKQEQRAWAAARAAMSREELAMSRQEWMKYYEEMVAASKEASVIRSGITRNLSISGFGVYNCDQIRRLENPVKVLASYINGKGEGIDAHTTYVLDKNVRGVLTYSGAYAGLKENEIAFDPGSTQSIMVIAMNGTVSVMKGDELKGKKFGSKAEFTMQELSSNLSDMNDLKKALGLGE